MLYPALVTFQEPGSFQNNTMNSNKKKLLDLLIRNKYTFLPILCRFYPFSSDQLLKYQSKLWWDCVSENAKIAWTPKLVSKYQDLLDWENRLWKNPAMPIFIDFIEDNNSKVNFEHLASNTGAHWNEEFILYFKDKWNWHHLLLNESIDWNQELFIALNLFNERLSILKGKGLWTEDFILKYMDKFNWWHLSYNPHLPWSIELMEKLKPIWSSFFFSGLSLNKGIPWSEDFLEKYAEDRLEINGGLKWSGLSLNESLPWNAEFVRRFESNWEWNGLSGNNKVSFDLEQIDKYKDKLLWKRNHPNFGALSDNHSLSWSEELIDTYLEKWDWEGLSKNEGIPWTEKMIEKYRPKLVLNELFRNPSLPWSLEFIFKYEPEILNAWAIDSPPERCSEIIWGKLNAKILDEELLQLFC